MALTTAADIKPVTGMHLSQAHSYRVLCPEHPLAILIEDYSAGDMICPECGLVVGDRVIDVSPEWRTFSSDEGQKDRSRVGRGDPLLPDSGLTTYIAAPVGPVPTDLRSLYQNRVLVSSVTRALQNAFQKIDDMVDRISGTRIVADLAKVYFKQVHSSGRVKTQNEAAVAACLFLACRKEGVAHTFKEVCAISGAEVKAVSRVYHRIKFIVGVGNVQPSICSFVPRFSSQLNICPSVVKVVMHVAEAAVQMPDFARLAPTSVVAGAIFFACCYRGVVKTSKEVAEVSGAADCTVLKVFRQMEKRAKDLLPTEEKVSAAGTSCPRVPRASTKG